MTRKIEIENIVRVKTALAEKYERRARNLRSQTGQAAAKRAATRHRVQAANLAKSAPA